ncbi:hypothetical protein H8958_003777 [Nasalis larvatus]
MVAITQKQQHGKEASAAEVIWIQEEREDTFNQKFVFYWCRNYYYIGKNHTDFKSDENKEYAEVLGKILRVNALSSMRISPETAWSNRMAFPDREGSFFSQGYSTFVLDECKRKYSNEDTLSVALPYFWEHFDKDGWSLWYSEYRFPEELTQTFMSCNLITGMFQRLDKLRKNAFASVILFGTNNSSSISGVWVFRSQELAFPLSPDWQVDYESYTWRKLDPGSEETQTLVREYFSWEGDFQHVGKAFNQGKIFK